MILAVWFSIRAWIWLYGLTALFILIIGAHLLWRHGPYLWEYRITKFLTILLTPSGLFLAIWFSIESFHLYRNLDSWLSFEISQILVLILIGLYVYIIAMLWIYVGRNWIMRRRFWHNNHFGPYLNYGKDPSTEMMINWGITKKGKKDLNQENAICHIRFGLEPESLIFTSTNMIQNHLWTQSIHLSNLDPNTQYYYQIPKSSQIYSFKTAPTREDTSYNSFQFVVVSDMHGSGKDISRTVKLIQEKAPFTQFILSAGDNVSDGRIHTHWKTLFGQLKPISPYLPFMSAPGNHDGELPESAQKWHDLFPYPYPNIEQGLYYSFQYGNSAFFVLDLYNKGQFHPYPGKDQIEWLNTKLEQTDETIQHKFLVLHKAIYTTGDFGYDPKLDEILIPIIEKFDIQCIFAGHSHLFEAFLVPKGAQLFKNPPDAEPQITQSDRMFLITGGGGARFDYCVKRPWSDTPYKWKSNHHEAKIDPYFSGDPTMENRNDLFVKKYQVFGELTHEILVVNINQNQIHIQAFNWDEEEIYSQKLEKSLEKRDNQ